MNRTRIAALSVAFAFAAAGIGSGRLAAQSAQLVHHDLLVTLEPGPHRITVEDHVRLAPGARGRTEFLLNARLAVTRSEPPVEAVPSREVQRTTDGSGPLKRYRVTRVPSDGVILLEYSGPIDFTLGEQKEEYTRGFREAAGLLTRDGVYLAETSGWYPRFGPGLLTFSVHVSAPGGWHVISQGSGRSGETNGVSRWESDDPMEEIYLVGGPLVVSRQRSGPVETLVYLHKPDPELAQKYLAAAGRYIRMYDTLIGRYPYGKFALVENFWETGYGMPSFTLLGPEVIRFPFILNTSYPHEILHNWWGNSVFVDGNSGNWCEGLTAYLADHLLQEQQGKGAEYRRGTLQKYRDYVKESRDFPLTAFQSRDSAATEAVGYGKALMVFHMLRRELGDSPFSSMLRQMYERYRGKRASWKDVERMAEAARGRSLAAFFDQWLSRPGAPQLQVDVDRTGLVSPKRADGYTAPGAAGAKAGSARGPGQAGAADGAGKVAEDGEFHVTGTLRQVQSGRPYQLSVPMVVQHAHGAIDATVRLDQPGVPFDIRCPGKPLALYVDPYFDVFRSLDPRETPASAGQVFGEPGIVAVVPSRAPAAEIEAYRALLAAWQSESHAIDIRLDSEIERLPADRSVWLMGRENRFARDLFRRQPGVEFRADGIAIDGKAVEFATHSLVLMTRHPMNAEKAVGWIVAEPIAAAAPLGRKLPHYGKYSYLAFEGREATNVLSGQWRDVDSPLRIDLRPTAERSVPLPALPTDPARALIVK